MTFDTRNGTRGARQPGGKVMLWMNKLMTKRVRRTGRGPGFNALVLSTVGRKTGAARETPVGWFPGNDGSYLIVASAAGAPRNPAWYYNLAAHPDRVQVETREHVVGILRTAALSEAADDAERELPDEVECQQAEQYLGRHGITKDELISRMGGSPLSQRYVLVAVQPDELGLIHSDGNRWHGRS